MTRYRTNIRSPDQVLIYFALFHDTLTSEDSSFEVAWEDHQLVFICDNMKTMQQAKLTIDDNTQVWSLNLQIQPIKGPICKAIYDLSKTTELVQLNYAKFSRLLANIKNYGIPDVVEFFLRKVTKQESFAAFIIKNSYLRVLEKALRGETTDQSSSPVRKSFTESSYELPIDFDDSQMIQLQLMDVFSTVGIRYQNIILVGSDSRLFAIGAQHECIDFTEFAERLLSNNEMLRLDVYDPTVKDKIGMLNSKLPSWMGAKVFIAAEALALCQQLNKKYGLKGPACYLANQMKSKQEFLMLYSECQHIYSAERIIRKQLGMPEPNQILRTPSKTSGRCSQDQMLRSCTSIESKRSHDSDRPRFFGMSKDSIRGSQAFTKSWYSGDTVEEIQEISSYTIKLSDYDERDFKTWFDRNKQIDPSNIMLEKYDSTVTVTLMGSKEDQYNTKIVGPFERYFNYSKGMFFKEEESEIARKVMGQIKGENSNYLMEYITGYGQYSYSELCIPEARTRQLALIKENIRDRGRHPFYCILFVGVHNIGKVIEHRIREAIREQINEIERVLEWSFVLQQLVSSSIFLPTLQQLIEKRITKQLEDSSCLKLISISWGNNSIGIRISPSTGASRQVLEMVRKSVKNLIENKLSLKLLRFRGTVSDLLAYPELSNSQYIFLSGDQGIALIGFDVQNQIHRINSIIESKMIERTISAELYFKLVLQQLIASILQQPSHLTITMQPHEYNMLIKLIGLAHSVTAAENLILQRIAQCKKEVRFASIDVSHQDIRVINQHKLLELLKKELPVRAKVCEVIDKQTELAYLNIKYTISSKQFSHLTEDNQRLVVFSEEDLAKHSSLERLENDGVYLYDRETKTCMLYEVKALLKISLVRDAEIVTYPPSNQKLKHFAAELMETLRIHKDVLPSSIRIFSRANRQREYEEMEFQIKNGIFAQTNIVWSWKDRDEHYPYHYVAQAKLTNALVLNTGSVQFNKDDLNVVYPTHVYDKNNNTLTHKIKKTVIMVDRLSPTLYSFDGCFGKMEIPADQIAKIDKSTSNEVPITLVLYNIDLSSMVQTNLYTGFQRRVCRQGDWIANPPNQLPNAMISTVETRRAVIQVYYILNSESHLGHRSRQRFQQYLSFYRVAKSNIEVNHNHMICKEFRALCRQYSVEVQCLGNKDGTTIYELEAYSNKDIDIIKQNYEIKRLLMLKNIEYPSTWIKGNEDIMQYIVPVGSNEFNKISSDFKIAPIKELYRIENKLIWKKYSEEKKSLEYITGETIRELYLFHGTRSHNPSWICMDKEEAFNINYSSERNYFGRGIYFAQEASYSKNYAHPSGNAPLRTILYCRVLAGTSQEMPIANKNCDIKDTNIRDSAKGIKYESIHSNYDGSDIYIVYKSRRAYPEYAIVF